MNKVKMGKFLKELREQKNLSQEKLAKEFAKSFLDVSTNAISGWEKGKSIPDIDKLNFLADFYGVTVDDILDGEKYENIDLDQIYHLHQSDYYMIADFAARVSKHDPTTNPVYYSITEEGEKIRKRFKQHIFNYINDDISRNDLKELTFFLKHYYILNEDISISTYLGMLRQLKNKKMSNEEKWWEAQRYIYPIDLLMLTFGNISDESFLSPTVQRRMNYSENWEKDMLLAMVQVQDPIFDDPNRASSKYIEKYEQEHGKPFDRERIIKDTIRYLIENGAMINQEFISYMQGNPEVERIIDTLERAHNAVVRPLSVCIREDEKLKFYYVENTRRNRFFVKYDYHLVRPLRTLGYSYDEMYKLVNENKTIPDEVYIRMAKLKGVDTNRDIRYIKGDVHINTDMFSLEHYWPQFHEDEDDRNPIERDNLELFREDLKNGKTKNIKVEFEWVGGTTSSEKEKYIFNKKPSMSYSDFKNGRQPNKTKELYEMLDRVSVEYIRNTFFHVGGPENA